MKNSELRTLVMSFIRTAQSQGVTLSMGVAAAAQFIALIAHKENLNIDSVLDLVRNEHIALRNAIAELEQNDVKQDEEDDFVRTLIGEDDE